MWDDLRRAQKDIMGVSMMRSRRTLTAMKRLVAITSFAAVLVSALVAPAGATEVGYGRNLGLGIELGNPTGFVGKYWIGRTNALDFGVGAAGYYGDYCTYDGSRGFCDGRLTMNADYLWQSNLVKGNAQLDWHIGLGGRLDLWSRGSRDYFAIAPRMPVGLDLMFNNPNFLEVFMEIAPLLYLGPNVGPIIWFAIDANIGVRFFF